MKQTSSREQILGRLRAGQSGLPEVALPVDYRPMVPVAERSAAELHSRFVLAARVAGCQVHEVTDDAAGIQTALTLMSGDRAISAWEPGEIGVPGLAEALAEAGVSWKGRDAAARIGLTGTDAGLAATGSLVLQSGPGRFRAASLLPPVHITLMHAMDILPDLESWWAGQEAAGLESVRRRSNIVVITGPSRTADIAMQLVMGMHGPRELHIILINNLT